jgi:hypothetical protein
MGLLDPRFSEDQTMTDPVEPAWARLGRNAAEVMLTIRDLGERGIVLRSLREGIDTSNATGRVVAGVLASSPSWSCSWAANAGQRPRRHARRATSPSADPAS